MELTLLCNAADFAVNRAEYAVTGTDFWGKCSFSAIGIQGLGSYTILLLSQFTVESGDILFIWLSKFILATMECENAWCLLYESEATFRKIRNWAELKNYVFAYSLFVIDGRMIIHILVKITWHSPHTNMLILAFFYFKILYLFVFACNYI